VGTERENAKAQEIATNEKGRSVEEGVEYLPSPSPTNSRWAKLCTKRRQRYGEEMNERKATRGQGQVGNVGNLVFERDFSLSRSQPQKPFFSSFLATLLVPIHKSVLIVTDSVDESFLVLEMEPGEKRFDDDRQSVDSRRGRKVLLVEERPVLSREIVSDSRELRVRV
jgi:hypothetical protein